MRRRSPYRRSDFSLLGLLRWSLLARLGKVSVLSSKILGDYEWANFALLLGELSISQISKILAWNISALCEL